MTIYHHDFENSSMLYSCGYDSNTKELKVTFRNSRTYIYEDVEQETYNDLVSSKSAGKHFNSIKQNLKIKT